MHWEVKNSSLVFKRTSVPYIYMRGPALSDVFCLSCSHVPRETNVMQPKMAVNTRV
jgi:hypothetical protein